MKLRTIYGFLCLTLLFPIGAFAAHWQTHLAYNNVTQIAMAEDEVFAISDGSLFSIDKQTEKLRTYDRISGLHGTGITCIHYDKVAQQLLICYADGKIDILTPQGMKYISELYNKDMTQRKNIYNVTILGRTAYLSTHYGVQTLDLRENKLVDSYWLRPGGEETPISDVLIANDSIYAFTPDSLFCAAMNDNLVDYHFWKREARSGRIAPDPEKGIHYQDATDHWYAGGAEGIVRFTPTSRLTYKPEGPLVNTPYRMRAYGNRLGVVQGGYAIPSYKRPGIVMLYNDGAWHNYDNSYILSHTDLSKVTDISDIIFDPYNPSHFFVSSFGYGLFEFRADTFYAHYNHFNSVLEPVLENGSYPYIWVDGLQLDEQGNLWMLNNSVNGIKVLLSDGQWVSISNAACRNLDRSKDILISVKSPNIKFISSIRNGIGVFDDNGTISDQSDDRAILCYDFRDSNGNPLTLERVSSLFQTSLGVLLIGTQQGLYRIDNPEEMLNANVACHAMDVALPEEGRYNIFADEDILCMVQNDLSQVWIGTKYSGAYLLSEDLKQVLAHISMENSPIPSNEVISLCWQESTRHLFIGTTEGLTEFDPNGGGEWLNNSDQEGIDDLDEGSMLRWKLHLSYYNPTEVVATPQAVYACANGSLFSVDRTDDAIKYWSKATGLNGTGVTHIAYTANADKLIVAYENGQIDMLDQQGDVTQMPDISMKAGSITVAINSICVGSHYTYLAMPFGIIAIQPRKAEVKDTYYIGTNAAAIDVQHVVEMGDSLYAFSYDRMYHAALQDNLVDYSYWNSEIIPFERVQQAMVHNGKMIVLAHDSLYRREGISWQLVSGLPLKWIHVSGKQLLSYAQDKGLLRLMEDDTWSGLSANYVANDAVYTNGEYWLAEESKGLVRLGSDGDTRFQPEGPMSNFGYHLDIAHDQLYVSPGGRWATMYGRQSDLSIYDGNQWRGIPWPDTWYYTDHNIRDVVKYAVDPTDAGHFFVATYGTGVFEFRDYQGYKHYDSSNSTLRKSAESVSDYYYTCTDGAMMDEQSNLWVMNSTTLGQPLHILTPAGQWVTLPIRSGGQEHNMTTPTGIWVDKRNSQYKWMFCQRVEPRVILLNDGGTPTISSDDRCMVRSSFIDQNGNVLTPAQFRCFAQDQTNRIWIGTDKGIILIPTNTDFFTSNSCRRIIIPRNDGTGLGDYLLGDEQINCLAVDGGNRIWIGTENSGLYLIEDDTITVAHFTETNSLLPSNSVQSIAIMPKTGEVFVGTNRGIASYRSDASEAQKTMSGAYAYPNPVRPNYGGMISISGLMDNTVVNIVDAGGNLVCKTKSHGGTAVWDCKLPDGRRATAGVYTALCNANGGHTVIKILVIR